MSILLWIIFIFLPTITHAQEVSPPNEIIPEVLEEPALLPAAEEPVTTASSTERQVEVSEKLQVSEPGVTSSVLFPRMSVRNLLQSALKGNDRFHIRVENTGPYISDVTIDFNELKIGTLPLPDSDTGVYSTDERLLFPFIAEGIRTYIVRFTDSLGITHAQPGTVLVDSTPPKGTVHATFTDDGNSSGMWTAHLFGTFDGTGSEPRVVDGFIYGIDAAGNTVTAEHIEESSALMDLSAPFSIDIPIPAPNSTWSAMGYTLTIADEAGNLKNVESEPVPVPRPDDLRIDHAISGSLVAPSNYEPGGIPPGVGIPYSLINTLPEDTYYAVVFFERGTGCPSDNYQINAFKPGEVWGEDIRPLLSKAFSTSAGGCAQQFRIDPTKGGDWMWGALDPNDSINRLIADEHGIPAFAICTTLAACNTIEPRPASALPGEMDVSNVLFLPGIKGSRLYRENPICFVPSSECDMPLWLPPLDLFVPQLFMEEDGRSVLKVYAKEGDILASAFGKKFYASFFEDLDEAQANGTFGEGWRWKPVPYDWRFSLSQIVNNGAERDGRIYYGEAATTPYIEAQLRQLAADSPTGKVTIVTHSNGGLVAKALMKRLGDTQSASLIDQVIMVGVPQSGAPRALGSLLYGDKEGIPGLKHVPDVIMTNASAREFGQNAPMAYHLLPSARYFEEALHPLVSFTGFNMWGTERGAYGPTITNSHELRSFALAEDGGRVRPVADDLTRPNVLNGSLLAYGQSVHDLYDGWTPPPGVAVHQIAGWGAYTIDGLDLYERPKTVLGVPTEGYVQSYRPTFIESGDGTVTTESALLMQASADVHRHVQNLDYAVTGGSQYTHGNMFELPALRDLLRDLIAGSDGEADTLSLRALAPMNVARKLFFFLHSSAEMELTDGGNYSGIRDGVIDESLPGTTYGELGEMKYLIAPLGTQQHLTIHGDADGYFTLDLQEMSGNRIVASTSVLDVPMTARTIARLTITDGIADTSGLRVDVEGDGFAELRIDPITGEVEHVSSTTPPIEEEPVEPEPEEPPVQEDDPDEEESSSEGRSRSRSGSSRRAIASATSTPSVPSIPIPVILAAPVEIPAVETLTEDVHEEAPLLDAAEEAQEELSEEEASTSSSSTVDTLDLYENQLAAVPESALMQLLAFIKSIFVRLLDAIVGIFR